MSGVAGHLSLILLFTYLTLSQADDRFTCCMGGWKVMRGVTLCAAPCCPGYQQKTLKMPLLDSPVICQKLTEEELKQQEEARMTTTPPAEPKNVLDDQPRRIIRASSEYEEFLYRHRHFFLHLMNEGYSRKELLTNMEQFLNKISSVLYQPDWYRG